MCSGGRTICVPCPGLSGHQRMCSALRQAPPTACLQSACGQCCGTRRGAACTQPRTTLPRVQPAQVEGCGVDLGTCRKYFQRYRVCEAHLKAPSLQMENRLVRFCDQCSRFHDLTAFEGTRRWGAACQHIICVPRCNGDRRLPVPVPVCMWPLPMHACTAGRTPEWSEKGQAGRSGPHPPCRPWACRTCNEKLLKTRKARSNKRRAQSAQVQAVEHARWQAAIASMDHVRANGKPREDSHDDDEADEVTGGWAAGCMHHAGRLRGMAVLHGRTCCCPTAHPRMLCACRSVSAHCARPGP